jgi:hypothetical protein
MPPKAITASEQLLLDTKPSELDDNDKKLRKTLQQRINQQKYRDNIKNSIGIDNFKNMKAIEAKEYRKQVKANKPIEEKVDKKVEKQPKVIVKRDIIEESARLPDVDTAKFNNDININPAWYTRLVKVYPNFKVNEKNYIDYRAYEEKVITNIIADIIRDISILDYTISGQIIEIIKSVLRGYNIENGKYKVNMDIFKKELSFLDNPKTLTIFINKLQLYYNNVRTVENKLSNFVYIISRIDSYKKSYQFLSKYASYLKDLYNTKRNDNVVEAKNAEKIQVMYENWDYTNVEKANNLIENSKLDEKEQAIASLYLLMPPRRLEWVYMVIADKKDKLYDSKNYLILDEDNKVSEFIFNKYKTAKIGGKIKTIAMGQQLIKIEEAVKPYLNEYLKAYNIAESGWPLFPINSDDDDVIKNNFAYKLTTIMKKIFKVDGITANTLRIGASMFNQAGNKSINEKVKVAEAMGHSEKVNQQYNKIIKKPHENAVKKILIPAQKVGGRRRKKSGK